MKGPVCAVRRPGCALDATFVAPSAAGGDVFACEPCVDGSDEPEAFIQFAEPEPLLAGAEWPGKSR